MHKNNSDMMKTIKSFFPMLLLTAGLIVWSGCSKDDDYEQTVSKEIPASPLLDAANTFNEQMAGLNFQELAPLAEVVPATTRANNGTRGEFETKLSTLLTLLQAEQATTRSVTLGHRFSFQRNYQGGQDFRPALPVCAEGTPSLPTCRTLTITSLRLSLSSFSAS